MESSSSTLGAVPELTARKPWEAPAIVLERPLETQAQRLPPQAGPDVSPVVGPFGTSGGSGNCT